MYREGKTTIRQLFPRSRDGNGLSVLLERRFLRSIFAGTSRDITKPIVAGEDTDLVSFLRMHLDASHEHGGGGYVEAKVRESLTNATSVGVLLGIVRLEEHLPVDCRVHDRRNLPKVVALAAKVHGNRKGAATFFSSLKANSKRTPLLGTPTSAAQYTDANPAQESSMATSGPPQGLSEAPYAEHVVVGVEDVDGGVAGAGGVFSGSPVSSVVEPLPAPPPKRIELINVEDCASLWKLRKYLTPTAKRRRTTTSLSQHAPTRAAVELHNRTLATDQRDGDVGRAPLRREAFPGSLSDRDAVVAGAFHSGSHPPAKRKRRYLEPVPDLEPPTGVMTRRQARALQEEEEAKAAAAAAAREAMKVAFVPSSNRARDHGDGSLQRSLRGPGPKPRMGDSLRAAKNAHHSNPAVTTESLQVVHLIDLDDKREKTYLKSIEKRRTRRRLKVETVDLTNVSSTESSDGDDLTLL